MSEHQPDDRLGNAVPPAGENLTEGQRRQMEAKREAEHEDGKEREKLIEEAQTRMGSSHAERPPGSRALPQPIAGRALAGLFILAIFYTIYFTRGLLFPIVLALLFTYLLAPVVRALAKIRIPRMLGAGLVIAGALVLCWALFSQIATPAAGWVAKAPHSIQALKENVRPLKKPMEKVRKAGEEIEKLAEVEESDSTEAVQVKERTLLEELLLQTPAFLASVATTIILLFFMLAYEDSFLRNVIRMFSATRQRHRAVNIARDVSAHVSRYLFTIACINTGLGIAVGIAMWAMGLPNPLLWGALATVLNFVPYLGALAGTVFVALAAILSFDQVAWALAFPAAYYALTAIEGTLVTPMILGRSFTLHPIAIVLGLLFWTWLWGVAGTLLAVPILVCLRIFAQHIRALRPLRMLLERDG